MTDDLTARAREILAKWGLTDCFGLQEDIAAFAEQVRGEAPGCVGDHEAVTAVWKALGIASYTGKHVAQHVIELVTERDALRRERARIPLCPSHEASSPWPDQCPVCAGQQVEHVTAERDTLRKQLDDELAAQDDVRKDHRQEVQFIGAERDDLRARKDQAYTERNRCVAMLAALFPSSLERHPEDDQEWEDDWRWVVYIDLPTGQASWHIHDSHLRLFDHVARFQGRRWDGHTTEEKYARLLRAALAGGTP